MTQDEFKYQFGIRSEKFTTYINFLEAQSNLSLKEFLETDFSELQTNRFPIFMRLMGEYYKDLVFFPTENVNIRFGKLGVPPNDYGMRIYDPRIGRFLSVDPLTTQYPQLTPYQFASNRPIDGIDRDGEEFSRRNIVPWLFRKNPKTGNSNADDIFEGAKKRAIETLDAMKKFFAEQLSSDNTTTIADPGIAKRNLAKTKELPNQVGEAVINTAEDYYNLLDRASQGDREAMGAILFEAALFGIPGDEGAKVGAASARSATRGYIAGSYRLLRSKMKAAEGGDLAAAAEIRVAKAYRAQGHVLRFIETDVTRKTPEFQLLFNGKNVEVKRLDDFKFMAKHLSSAVEQVGENGIIIVVRPSDAKLPLSKYQEFINIFVPRKSGVQIIPVNESDLPPLKK
jgi:RHS repeat-associated protein